jgi:hypothetical protein
MRIHLSLAIVLLTVTSACHSLRAPGQAPVQPAEPAATTGAEHHGSHGGSPGAQEAHHGSHAAGHHHGHDPDQPYATKVRIDVFKDGRPVAEGEPVGGRITAKVTVTEGQGQHAQFYGNFIVLDPIDGGVMIDADPWIRTLELDTSMFFDGENLLSAHTHPHNVPGRPLNTDLAFGTFKVVAENGRPAPQEDRLLPSLNIQDNLEGLWKPDAQGGLAIGIAGISDDVKAGNQIIVHLGSSVLGRWSTLAGQADGFIASDVALVYFQREKPVPARLVFFISDAVGRANYAYKEIVLPPLAPGARDTYPLPAPDARILDIDQGDSIVVTDAEDQIVRIEVSHLPKLSPTAYGGPRLRLWSGNQIVAITPLLPYIEKLKPGETSFIVETPIRVLALREQEKYTYGPGATARALWTDIRYEENGTVKNFPTADHVHLSSLRIGATVARIEPEEGPVTGGTSIRIDGFGYFNGELPTVLFDGIPAAGVENVNGELRVYTPSSPRGGRVDVTIQKSNGSTARLARGFTYKYPPLAVTSVTPNQGPHHGGTKAVLQGENLTPDMEILFDGTPVDHMTWVSPSRVEFEVPYYSTRVLKHINKASIEILRPDGSSVKMTGWYTYLATDTVQTLRRAPQEGSR